MWRIVKTELISPRNEWMMQLLLKLSPRLYESTDNRQRLVAALRLIRLKFTTLFVPAKFGKLSITASDRQLDINNKNGNPFLRFTIEEC